MSRSRRIAISARSSADTGPLPGVSVIGAGNWGASLIEGLRIARIPLHEIVTRTGSSARGKRDARHVRFDKASFDAKILWLCVPDAAIEPVVSAIVRRRRQLGHSLRGQIVVHSSGALTARVLGAAAAAKAQTGSIHPVMTFPTRRPVSLAGVLFGIEANAGLRRTLTTLVRKLGGKPLPISSRRKVLYHAAGMFASPLLVSALAAALDTAELAGLGKRDARLLVEALARASANNFFLRGPKESFSGPLARGDAATIDLHLRALASHPMLREVYRALARYSLDALPVRDRRKLKQVLE